MRGDHIKLAQKLWSSHLRAGDVAIDATCGNGHDTLFLAKLALTPSSGSIHAIDIQPEAIASTHHLLTHSLKSPLNERVHYHLGSHATFPCIEDPISLIIYNLGYLPRGDKRITTQTRSTIESIQSALSIIKPGGLITIMCYPGHEEGKKELDHLLLFMDSLKSCGLKIDHHTWSDYSKHPSLFEMRYTPSTSKTPIGTELKAL